MTRSDSLFDHLVYKTDNLEKSVEEIGLATGIYPVFGGRHLGLGTKNYLLGLGPRQYLEIIAVDTEQSLKPGAPTFFGVTESSPTGIITWALERDNLEAAVEANARYGLHHGPILDLSRKTAEGGEIAWRIASAGLHGDPLPLNGTAPFVIAWKSAHPSASLPQAELGNFAVQHPDASTLNKVLSELNCELRANVGEPLMQATIRGPRGSLTI